MSEPFKFPTAEEITRDWGERCPDVDQDCGCCQMWNTYDLIAAKDAQISRMRDALLAAKEVVDVAEGMTSCRSDDDFIWSAQKKIAAALNGGSDAP